MAKSINIADELKKILDEYGAELNEKKEEALNEASDYLAEKLAVASPVRTGKLRQSWISQKKYYGVKYIGNSAEGSTNQQGYKIPLTNLLEYGSKGHPFIRKTFEAEKNEIINIIKRRLNNGNTK